MPPEVAHDIAIQGLKYYPKRRVYESSEVDFSNNVLGLHFKHPIGLAAGFDKNGKAIQGLGNIGFSHIEVGSVTPEPQPGNPKPRLFRLSEEKAIINRYGFNSDGAEKVLSRLKKAKSCCVTAINLGVNKSNFNYVEGFLRGIEVFNQEADYITLNISSPNTDGLRNLHSPQELHPIISRIRDFQHDCKCIKPIVVKISPDNDLALELELLDYLSESNIDGVIVSNTTVDRTMLPTKYSEVIGGLSGSPLKRKSYEFLSRVSKVLYGKKVIIASGGIESGEDAYMRLKLGADLLQVYTSFIYQGPNVINNILQSLEEKMIAEGYYSIKDIKRELSNV
nr:dihydroorotate dehydrogenase (quinone) [Vibrio sp. S9_S30]